MFFEFVQAVLTFDLNWLATLLFSNFHYLFAFVAACFFFWNGNVKKTIVAFFLLSIVIWAAGDFSTVSGWMWAVGGFFSIYYISKVAVMAFAETVPQLRRHLVFVSAAQFWILFIIYNMFLR